MHICEVSQYFYPYLGGQEAYVRGLSEHLTERGHRVSVLTTTAGSSSTNGHIDIVSHPARVTLLNNPITAAAMRERRLLQSCDIIHLHNEHSFLSLTVAAMKHGLTPPLCITVHGRLKLGEPALDAIEALYTRHVGRRILTLADNVFVNSPEDLDRVAGLGVNPRSITEVSNAIDSATLRRYRRPDAKEWAAATMGLSCSTRIVLYVGRMIRRKGLPTLMEAFSRLPVDVGDVTLVLVGDGPLRQGLGPWLRLSGDHKRVISVPYASRETLYSLYQAADVFALPSVSEVCPTVVLEALFFGCTVVASDIPGIRDHFGKYARLFPPEDAIALAEGIADCLAAGRDMEARVWDAELDRKYSWARVGDAYLEVFESLVGHR